MDASLNYFRRPAIVKYQCLMLLYFNYLYWPSQKQFERLFAKFCSQDEVPAMRKSVGDGFISESIKIKATNRLKAYLCRASKDISCVPAVGTDIKECNKNDIRGDLYNEKIKVNDSQLWDCQGFIKLPVAFKYYQTISCSWMIYVLVKYFLGPNFLSPLISLIDNTTPGHCYLLGRFAYANELSIVGGVLFSLFHIMWRTYQTCISHTSYLNLLHFLMQTEHDLDRFYEIIMPRDRIVNSISAPKVILDEKLLTTKPSVREDYFRSIICYIVFHRSQVTYHVRPNRTRKSFEELRTKLAHTIILLMLFMAFLTVVMAPIITYVILCDLRYVEVYQNCSMVIENKKLRGELNWASMTPTMHRAIAFFIDAMENTIIWFDSGIGLLCNFALLYMLNFDINLYWRHLNSRVELMLRQARQDHEEHNCSETMLKRSSMMAAQLQLDLNQATDYSPSSIVALNFNISRSNSLLTGSLDFGSSRNERHMRKRESRSQLEKYKPILEADQSVYLLQSQIVDFFKLVENYDRFISGVLTNTIMIWLISFAFLSYNALSPKKTNLPFQVHLMQLFHLIVFVTSSWTVLGLHRSCLKTYQSICSLMALDTSKHKGHFLKILEYFTKRKRTMYTLFGQYPYTPTTFLSIIGWTFSCFFIMDSLFRYG